MTFAYFVIQIIVGLAFGSLALISDAGHMLIDSCGLLIALLAVSFTQRPATPKRTYGFYRTEIIFSLLNSIILVLLSGYILYEAYHRILEPAELNGYPIVAVASIGLGVNLIAILLLHPHTTHKTYSANAEIASSKISQEQNLNIYGAYLEIFSDTLGSAGVIIAGIIILTTKFYLADALVSIGIAIFILPRTWSLLRKSVHILIEGAPSHLCHEEIKKSILDVRGVTGVFDLHIWTITSGIHALSAHVVVINQDRSHSILQEINSLLEKKFNISHATIQIEPYHQSDNI